ncbi:hypothetical protein AV530_013251 [Patagioenas fasciata monilis]|uniref:Uncharacterized protein n=1 Tax=Patagioenas fasciata monilis TaxID=372326 RepID=A0A1V4JNQ1_PATFA|nr:hypothetical protein AV530_013251 [Patagioenas fasciata monilis]
MAWTVAEKRYLVQKQAEEQRILGETALWLNDGTGFQRMMETDSKPFHRLPVISGGRAWQPSPNLGALW